MKILNRICQVLTIVFGLGSLVLFFTQFAEIVTSAGSVKLVGTEFAFGGKVSLAGAEYDMARSSHLLLCFLLTAIGALIGVFSFKSKKLRYATSAFGIITAVYMLVVAFSKGSKFFDMRPLENITEFNRTPFVLFTAIALVLFAVVSVSYLLIDDYLEVAASKGDKLTIPKRVVRFLRDYKSEGKKIVWPGIREVVKNVVIVLIMCLLVGALIWLVDFGLGQLITLILGK